MSTVTGPGRAPAASALLRGHLPNGLGTSVGDSKGRLRDSTMGSRRHPVGDGVHRLDHARRQVPQDRRECFVQSFVLPDTDDRPAVRHQPCGRVAIPLDVRLQLRRPPRSVVRRPRRVLRAAMPEAAVDEDSDPSRGEHDVSPSTGYAREWNVYAVPIPKAMQSPPQRDLWGRVARPLLRHPSGSRWIGQRRRGAADYGGSVGRHRLIMLRVEDQRAYRCPYNSMDIVDSCRREPRQ